MLFRTIEIGTQRLKSEGVVKPSFCTRPYDTPYHLRDAYEKALNDGLEAGQIVAFGTEQSQWASLAFPVSKGNWKKVRIISDFKKLN